MHPVGIAFVVQHQDIAVRQDARKRQPVIPDTHLGEQFARVAFTGSEPRRFRFEFIKLNFGFRQEGSNVIAQT